MRDAIPPACGMKTTRSVRSFRRSVAQPLPVDFRLSTTRPMSCAPGVYQPCATQVESRRKNGSLQARRCLVVQVHLEGRSDPGEYQAGEQTSSRTDRSCAESRPGKGEAGIRDRLPAPTLKCFAERDFTPFIEARFQSKPKTLGYYKNGIKSLNNYAPLASCVLDAITAERIAGFIAIRRAAGLQVSSVNRELEVLRRIFKLAMEWGKVEKALPKVEMLRGENHRDRVLSGEEEARYLEAAEGIGEGILESYRQALDGIRATMRGQQPIEPTDPFVLRDVTTILADCGLRPEECFRLRWEHIRDGAAHVPLRKNGERAAHNSAYPTGAGDSRNAACGSQRPVGLSCPHRKRSH